MQAPSKTYFAVLGNFDDKNIPRGKIYSTSTLDVSTFFGQIVNNQISSADIQIDDLNEEEEEEPKQEHESTIMRLVDSSRDERPKKVIPQIPKTTPMSESSETKHPDAVSSETEPTVTEPTVSESSKAEPPEVVQPEAKSSEAVQPQESDQNKLLESIQKMNINTEKKVEDANNLIKELKDKNYSEPVIDEYRTAFKSMLKNIGKNENTNEKTKFLNNNKVFFKTLCGHYDNKGTDNPISLCDNLGISASIYANFKIPIEDLNVNEYLKDIAKPTQT
jgi:hypothetical protein